MDFDQTRLIVESTSDVIFAYDMARRLLYVNPAFETLTGYSVAKLRERGYIDYLHPEDASQMRALFEGLWRGESFQDVEFRIVTRAGEVKWCLSSWGPLLDERGVQVGVRGRDYDITARKRADAALRQSEERFRFLFEAGALLSASLDYETRLQSVARLAVPRVADWCAVDVLGENGALQRLAVEHVDPAMVAWAYELQREYPTNMSAATGLANVLRTGQPLFIPQIDDAMLVAAARDPRHLQIMRRIGFSSVMIMPLTARGRTFGAISLVASETGRHYAADDLALAEELGRRASLAVDNAWLYRETHAQREWLRGVLSSIGDAVIATDSRGAITFMNPVAEALTGWPQAEAAGRTLDEVFRIVSEMTGAPVESPVVRVLREGTVVGLANHTLLLPRDGDATPIDDSGAPIRDNDGQIEGVVLVFRDISERKRAEDQLAHLHTQIERQRRRLKNILATVPGVVWEAWGQPDAASQRIDFVSDYVETLLGYRIDEWLATPNFWLTIVHPDDKERAARESMEIYASGQGGTNEFRWVAKNGRVLWVEAQTAVICDDAGDPIGMRGITMDISARKRAEETQRFLAEASAILAASLDYQVTLEHIARLTVPDLADWCAVHMLEEDGMVRRLAVAHIDRARAVLARARPDRYPLDERARYLVASVLRTGQPEVYNAVPGALLAAAARDAEHLSTLQMLGFSSYICVPLLAHGRTLGTITLVAAESGRQYEAHDLELAEELARRAATAIENARLYREAQEAVRAREVFLSVASHELKTPLTSLLGNTQLLQRRAQRENHLGERDQRSLQLIAEQALRLNRMISALLDLSRLQTGQLSIERAPLDLGALAHRMIREAQPGLDQHTIVYSPPDDPLMIVGDELRLEQVIQNLIQNAIKYSPSGGQIDVRVARRGAMACVAVADQGIGIPPAALPRLFTRFYRAANANPLHISGMGVGLYVVKEIMTLHGGEVTVESQEGAGSMFTICLPLATDDDDRRLTADD